MRTLRAGILLGAHLAAQLVTMTLVCSPTQAKDRVVPVIIPENREYAPAQKFAPSLERGDAA